ncbi:GumC family protein [Rhodovulum sp. DZ06]|uniref:GumC family protein n=1 Tax=Rhodovulum sp. DZ06 TaxID=3425126 RepID=UPI003D3363E8
MTRTSAAQDPAPTGFMREDTRDVEIGALVNALWRQKLVIGAFAFVAMVLATAFVYAVTPLYRSSAVVMTETRQEEMIDLETVMAGIGTDYYARQAELEILRSRTLAERVVKALDLEALEFFNPTIIDRADQNPYNLFNLLFAAMDLFKSTIRETVSDEALPTADDFDRDYWSLQRTIDSLLGTLEVQPVGETYVYSITISTDDPELSAEIANKYAELYILEQLEVKFEATQNATNWLSGRVAELKTALESAEAAREEFISSTPLISEEQLSGITRQVKELRERETGLKEDVVATRARAQELERLAAAGNYRAAADLVAAPRLIGLAADIEAAPAGARRDALVARFEAELVRQAERLTFEQDRATSQAAALRETIRDLEAQFERQSTDLVQLRQLEREAEASRLIYEYFLNRMKETSVQQGIQQADSRILSPAVIHLVPSYPKKSATVMLAGMLGVVLGSILVLVKEQLNKSFRTSEDLEKYTGLPALGMIPAAPVRSRRKLLEYGVNKPDSAMMEAIRNLRTGVLMANMDRAPQVVMLTSTLPKEGKTTSSILLSLNAAALGKSVLLIEGDLRRRTFPAYFEAPRNQPGLLSVLAETESFENAVLRDQATGLDVLLGEDTRTNAADVFSSQKFRTFIDAMRHRYDMVVIDTPPVMAVPDARVIAPLADAIIYCVHWNQTHRDLVRQGLTSFSQIKIRVTGMALTQIDQKKMASYGYGGYGAYYSASSKYHKN